MFFMIGTTSGRKDFDYRDTVICGSCGRYGSYHVFMTYLQLLLFFIPCFRWNRRYFVEMSCCGTIYELDPAVGERIARGEHVEIHPSELRLVQRGQAPSSGTGFTSPASAADSDPYANAGGRGAQDPPEKIRKRCRNCGYTTGEDFDYCPKCGHALQGVINI